MASLLKKKPTAVTFIQILVGSIRGMFPGLFYWLVFPLVPFMIAEQIWPVGKAPGWRNYGMNLLIAFSTVFLSLPLGIAAGLWSAQVRQYLFHGNRFRSPSITSRQFRTLDIFWKFSAMILVPLFLHDFWFYWAHRIEHKVPFLWAFHKLHHSDELMNTSTWARDHFLQNSWRAFFSIFTLGMIVDLDLSEAGKAALYSTMFLSGCLCFITQQSKFAFPGSTVRW